MKRADSFAAGAVGEEAVAAAIAPLTAEGWNILHDRVMPTGGNIDHIVIGPGSVVVLDAKAWNGALEVRNDRLYNSGWSQAKALEKLTAATLPPVIVRVIRPVVGEIVKAAVRESGVRAVSIAATSIARKSIPVPIEGPAWIA